MIRSVVHTALLVRDYDEAKQFYCEKLGFELVEDTLLPTGKRWVRIRAAGHQGSDILLSRAVGDDQRSVVGNQAGGRVLFFLHTDDLSADYKRMHEGGVEFVEEPHKEIYGTVAVFKDLYGNRIDLIEPPRKRTPKQVLSEWVRLMNTHEPEALAELYDENATNLQIAVGKPLTGKRAIREDFRAFFSNIPDSFTTLENLFEDGEWAILEWSGGGTFKPTAKTFTLCGCGFFRVKDEKIVFQRGYWDKFTWFRQIGLPLEE
jgi:catechol 2,3-dioxygenase-like lactoylglutathione lyase family enzyme